MDFAKFQQQTLLVHDDTSCQFLDESDYKNIKTLSCPVSWSSATGPDVRSYSKTKSKLWGQNLIYYSLTIYDYFCLTWFSEDYSWIRVAFLTSNVWLTICLHYRWNNRSILKFQISKFQKLKFQNFKNWNFKILKLEISNFEFLKIKIVREAILSTCFSEIDLNDINLATKCLLYCHWYLVFFTWFINWKRIAGFPMKVGLFRHVFHLVKNILWRFQIDTCHRGCCIFKSI